jgi:hypothetical protein
VILIRQGSIILNEFSKRAWVQAGFVYQKRDNAWHLVVNDGKTRDSPDFSELWHHNCPIEALSSRRRAQKWGFMNRQYFQGKYLKKVTRHGLN